MALASRPLWPGVQLALATLRAPGGRARGAGSARARERLGVAGMPRPPGPVVWLHATTAAQEVPLAGLAGRVLEVHPDACVLITGDAPLADPRPLPAGMLHQLVPNDASGPVRAFLDHWQPDIGLWAGAVLRPSLIHAAADRGVLLHLIDASGAPAPERGWRRLSRLSGSALGRFVRILATDRAAAAALVGAGAAAPMVEVTGPLESEVPALGCNLHERDTLAEVLKARPVWFAAGVPEAEEQAVLAAHAAAARLAHRLLLIIAPSDPARGPAIAERAAAAGFSTALRSVEGEPSGETDIFMADGEGEYGLWYRLAPVSYMGGTLAAGASGSHPPTEPAALGSAILHGPMTGVHGKLYRRFAEAGAAREIPGAPRLGPALSDLLAPDRAAALAHAAWQVSTGGAAMTERLLALVDEALVQGAGG